MTMRMRMKVSNVVRYGLLICSLLCLSAATLCAERQEQATAPQQKSFGTPQLAVDALIQAAASYDVPALLAIFGPDGEDLVSSADPVRDKNTAKAFAAKAK